MDRKRHRNAALGSAHTSLLDEASQDSTSEASPLVLEQLDQQMADWPQRRRGDANPQPTLYKSAGRPANRRFARSELASRLSDLSSVACSGDVSWTESWTERLLQRTPLPSSEDRLTDYLGVPATAAIVGRRVHASTIGPHHRSRRAAVRGHPVPHPAFAALISELLTTL